MTTFLLFALGAALWQQIGYHGGVYFWTGKHDLNAGDRVFILIMSIMGPISVFSAWVACREPRRNPSDVIKPRRTK